MRLLTTGRNCVVRASSDTNLQTRNGLDLDKVGAAASLICAAHCALMPFVITLLPLLGLSFLANEGAEWTLLGLSALLGLSSLCLGFRQHRRGGVLIVLGAGLGLLVSGRVVEGRGAERIGVPLVIAGGCVIASSHFLNRRLCLACRRCHPAQQK